MRRAAPAGGSICLKSGLDNAPRRSPVRHHPDAARGAPPAHRRRARRQARGDGPDDLSRCRGIAGEPGPDRRRARHRLRAAARVRPAALDVHLGRDRRDRGRRAACPPAARPKAAAGRRQRPRQGNRRATRDTAGLPRRTPVLRARGQRPAPHRRRPRRGSRRHPRGAQDVDRLLRRQGQANPPHGLADRNGLLRRCQPDRRLVRAQTRFPQLPHGRLAAAWFALSKEAPGAPT